VKAIAFRTADLRRRLKASNALGVAALGATLLLLIHALSTHHAGLAHIAIDDGRLMAAVMAPLAGTSANVVAERAIREHRAAAVAEHVLGFAGVWFCYAFAVGAVMHVVAKPIPASASLALCLTAASIWQLSMGRLRLVERCRPVHVSMSRGWRAHTSTTTNGARVGIGCIGTCWASMLAMAAAPVMIMPVVAAASLSEWAAGRNPFARERRRRPVPTYIALAISAIVWMFLQGAACRRMKG